MLINVVKF